MKKFFIIAVILSFFMVSVGTVFAQKTILPEAGGDESCEEQIQNFDLNGLTENANIDQLLGCAIKTGRVSVEMVPYFIQYFSNYALGLVSILALLFIAIGGWLYTLGGMTEQKEKGKTFIKNAIIGMIIAFLAWGIVNAIISSVTG